MTKAEKQHLSRVAEIGCIVCRRERGEYVPAEIHHVRRMTGLGVRPSHYDTLPLCPIHHRTGGPGLAFHAGRRMWECAYGTQTELLEQVTQLLGDGQC